CVNNHGVDQTRAERNTWANQVLAWGAEPDNTNALLLTEALLGDAIGKSVRAFKCPADQLRADNGERLRTYPLNCMVGNPGKLLDEYNRDFRQFFRSSDFARPNAVFLFLDEHPDTINDGFYMIRLGRYEWSNLPASFHNGSANVSFADGHAETHRWSVTGPNGTVRPAVRGAVNGQVTASRGEERHNQRPGQVCKSPRLQRFGVPGREGPVQRDGVHRPSILSEDKVRNLRSIDPILHPRLLLEYFHIPH